MKKHLLIAATAAMALALVSAPAMADPFADLSKQLAKDHGIPDFQLDPSEFGSTPEEQAKTLAKELKYVAKHGYTVDYVAPVDGIPGTPGIPGVPSKPLDSYKYPTGESASSDLWQNQCWFNRAKTVKTAGTQNSEGYCIPNGTLATLNVGGRDAIPGTPEVPPVERSCTVTGKDSYSC